jgi:hypothetical protein
LSKACAKPRTARKNASGSSGYDEQAVQRGGAAAGAKYIFSMPPRWPAGKNILLDQCVNRICWGAYNSCTVRRAIDPMIAPRGAIAAAVARKQTCC